MEAEVYVTLKKTVADPQGLTVKHALESLGYDNVDEVRMGKLVKVKLKAKGKKEASDQIKRMCDKLLANPVIEDYSFTIQEAER